MELYCDYVNVEKCWERSILASLVAGGRRALAHLMTYCQWIDVQRFSDLRGIEIVGAMQEECCCLK